MYAEYCVDCETKTTIYTCSDLKTLRRFLPVLKSQGYKIYSFDEGHFWLFSSEYCWTIVLKLKDLDLK